MGMLSNISGREAAGVFAKIGYYQERREGSHMILCNKMPGFSILSIPDHKELAPGLLRGQIKRAGLSVEEFLKLGRK